VKQSSRILVVAAAATAVLLLTGCGGTASAGGPSSSSGDNQVTVYSADGLADWYTTTFAAFTAETGITVNYVEAGSGEVVSRAEKEKSNPQADVLVTVPPFIQQADRNGLLQKTGIDVSAVAAGDQAPDGTYVSLVGNYATMIRGTTASPRPDAWTDLLAADYAGKIQYSTPGQAGDGTALFVLLEHLLGKQGALDYFTALQANNVGPSASTGKLGPKVSKGELSVANSDVQMALQSISADKSAYEIFFPTTADGTRVTVAVPYVMGLAAGAPHKDNADKLMGYLLSQKVQETISASALGFPIRTDVTPTDANYAALEKAMAGVTAWQPDWSSVLADLDADLAAYNTATGQ